MISFVFLRLWNEKEKMIVFNIIVKEIENLCHPHPHPHPPVRSTSSKISSYIVHLPLSSEFWRFWLRNPLDTDLNELFFFRCLFLYFFFQTFIINITFDLYLSSVCVLTIPYLDLECDYDFSRESFHFFLFRVWFE